VFRFGAVLSVVVVAIGLLVGGVLTSSLRLVVASIGVAALAGLLLVIGVLFRRDEIFGGPAAASARHQPVSAAADREVVPLEASGAATVASAVAATSATVAGASPAAAAATRKKV